MGDTLTSVVNDSENTFGCGRQVRDVTVFSTNCGSPALTSSPVTATASGWSSG
jgi:hypothetical protein